MPCEHYREALTETVAADSALARELREHLEECPPCREFFAQEQQLFAGIDSGVRVVANPEVPAAFLLRVRVGLNEQRVPRRSWFTLGAALASAAVLLTIVLLVRGHGRHSSQPNLQGNAVARGGAPAEAAGIPTRVVASRTQAARHRSRERSPRVAAASAVPPAEVRVLLPAGQKEAMDALLIALRTGAVDGDILVADKPETSSQDGVASPPAISPIEIKPLPPVSEEPAPESQKTGR
ncbi:MAG TPA: hypothetical protein VE077_15020 [Candidatus Methylomirabilis sp.]|nr:hypothetical protein [Candidatus Methylomirabilis sp.]